MPHQDDPERCRCIPTRLGIARSYLCPEHSDEALAKRAEDVAIPDDDLATLDDDLATLRAEMGREIEDAL